MSGEDTWEVYAIQYAHRAERYRYETFITNAWTRSSPRHVATHQLLRLGDRQPRARVRGRYRLRYPRARAPPARVRRSMAAAAALLAGRGAREDRRRRREGARRRRDPPPLRSRGNPRRLSVRALSPAGARDAVRDRPAHGALVLQRRLLRRACDADGGAVCTRAGSRSMPGTRSSPPGSPCTSSGGTPPGIQSVRVRTRRGQVVLASDATPLLRQRRGGRALSHRARRGGDARGVPEAAKARDLSGPHHPRA